MKGRVALVALVLCGLSIWGLVRPSAQTTDDIAALKRQIEALAAGQAAIQKQLEEIRTLLRERPVPTAPARPAGPAPGALVGVAGAPTKGDANAKVTIVEFSDYQCPFCGRYTRDTLAQIQREYIDAGKVRYVFRNLPLESIHPHAFKASEAALCAGDQGKYWQMHDHLFANQTALDPNALVAHARSIHLDEAIFQQCLNAGRHAPLIRQDLAEARSLGATGTPAFFIGLTVPGDQKMKMVRFVSGAQPYTTFKAAIDSLLASQQ